MSRALCLLLVACGGSQIADHTKDPDLTRLLPATLEASKAKGGDPRPIHVRVWADAGIRALPHWKEDIAEQVDYASQLLQPMLGIRLVIDKTSEWTRNGDPAAALADLAQADDGKDATWVIGYVTPPDTTSKAMSQLGDAKTLGHAVIVRGWAEKAETDALAGRLPDLNATQRSEVISAHRRHKQSVVLLHMLAVTLGAIDDNDPTWIDNPLYSPKQNTFSDRNRELMQLAIDARLTTGTDLTIAHDLLEAIERQDWGGWIAADHDDVVKTLRNVVDSAKAGKTAVDVPPAAYEQFDRIRELGKKGQVGEALAELDNILSAYPGNATMHELKCELLITKPGIADKATRTACARVSELAPGDPSPHLAVGEALANAKDLAGAHAELVQAAGKIGNLKTGGADAWRKLIEIYTKMGALTWTEEAIAAAKLEGDPAGQIVAQTRARYGVPRGTKVVKPDAEAALVSAVRSALDLVYANKFGDAEHAIATAERKWPSAPGLAAARCDLALRQGQVDAARAACARALAADPQESWALYLSGVISLKDASTGGTKQGIDRLKRAIAVDADLGQAWRTLAKAYVRANDQAALDQLGKDYAAKFGQALPQ